MSERVFWMNFEKYLKLQIEKHPSVQPKDLVNSQYIRIVPMLEQVAERLQRDKMWEKSGKVCVIAIDGRAASGKSTLAKQLGEILEADIIHMDDFFLPIPLRTEERFQTPGGNVHYERFMEEVLPYLGKPQPFSYRKFDCSRMDYNGNIVVGTSKIRIVEGSYSCHPLFGRYADITVFSDVEPHEQSRRILQRNGEAMAEMFRTRWIPLEEQYFETYNISEKADLKL